MNWLIYACGAAVALAIADVLVKVAAGKLPTSLGVFLYGIVPFLAGLAWFLADKTRTTTPVPINVPAVMAALGVGVAFTLVTIGLYAAFRAGAPISIASPLIRVGGLLVASVVGVLLWKEAISARYVVGIVLSLIGIMLIIKG